MREQKTIVDGVEFGTIFQFQKIFGAIASSMQPARMLVAFGMVLVLLATGYVWDSISSVDASTLGTSTTQEEVNQQRALAIAQAATAFGHNAPAGSSEWTVGIAQSYVVQGWQDLLFEGNTSLEDRAEYEKIYLALELARPRGPFEQSSAFVSSAWTRIVDGGLQLDAVQMWGGVVAIVWELPQLLWNGGYHWFISLYGFLLIYVLCIGGGAISRMQACWFSRAEQLRLSEAIDFSTDRWRELLAAVFGPAMLVAALTLVLMLMGLLLMNIPWLNFIGGLLYGVSLLLGFCIAIIAVGYAACFPMIVPAVVIENCSGGEAIQRSFAYLFSKTMHYFGYVFVLIVSLVLGYLVVRLVANLTLDITANIVGAATFNNSLHGAGSLQMETVPIVGMAWYESGAGYLIALWETIVHDLMIGWVFSGFFSTSTMLYLLMRRASDGQDAQDLWSHGIIQGTNVVDNAED
ncbi:MAG: hypothetical protein H8E86_05085 [Planctomycetes bacterium]|nr:hypothetical protein [Planctomycetota bacterium]